MTTTIRRLTLAAAVLLATATLSAKDLQRRQLVDDGWEFALNDSTRWTPVSLPHDWSITLPFDRLAPAGNDGGYLPTGKGWYRKTLTLSRQEAAGVVRLYFEGVYMNAEVTVNGHPAGGHPYGYSSFFCDLTPHVHAGRNTIEVRVDNSQQKNCRWYSGSGIYRHVWLLTTGRLHLNEWDISLRPQPVSGSTDWQLHADARYTDSGQTGAKPEIRYQVLDAEGRQVAASAGGHTAQTLTVKAPKLWSPDSPYLYRVKTQLVVGGAVADEVTTTTGFRSVTYNSREGLLLNGTPIVLNGGCLHHDNGILGAAAYDRAERRKAELMKQAGFNAVRTSHNLPSEAFLQACDEVGLLVIDEAFDGWREPKNAHDYATLIDQWWREDLTTMVKRDRNHPSIFCWSIGNEVIERKKLEVVKTAHLMASLCRELDPTRPVTSALASWDKDWDIYDPLAAEHDIVGYNYLIHHAEADHERVPSRVMMQTESYPRDAWQNYVKVRDNKYIVGDFVWTAVDYLGESGIGRWYYEGEVAGEHWERPLYPWHAAYCGDIDLTGLRKPVSHYRSMLWNADGEQLYMAVREPDGYQGTIRQTRWGTWPTFESWNWPGHEGKPIEVEVCSRYPQVRLILNGRTVGTQTVSEHRAVFTLPYEPGTLRAEGLNGQTVAECVELATAGPAARLRLTADRQQLKADGQDLAFITVEVTDAEGRVLPTAATQLTANVSGQAQLIAMGNADIKDEDCYTDATHRTWHGRALIVLKAGTKRGKARLKVTADGMPAAELNIALVASASAQHLKAGHAPGSAALPDKVPATSTT